MTPVASITRAALVTLLALGCTTKPDSGYIDLDDFDSGKQLADSLKRRIPAGTQVTEATETMEASGFKCWQLAPTVFDRETRQLGSGKPYLECYRSWPIELGTSRRAWAVDFRYDTAGVTDISAGYIHQDTTLGGWVRAIVALVAGASLAMALWRERKRVVRGRDLG